MMQVRNMCVVMCDRIVPMGVAVCTDRLGFVDMVMVTIVVRVRMVMFHGLMSVLVRM